MSQANPIPATLTYDPETDRPQEECGVFAVYNAEDAGVLTALGLHALQHRGQEACGIATHDGSRFHIERYLGLVGENFTSPDMPQRLPGKVAIGHARYSTQGASVLRNVQPLYSDVRGGGIALAHNGNLTNARVLREELVSHGAIFQSTSDSEVVLHLAAQSKKTKLTNRVLQALKQVQGAFAFVALVNDRLIAARDPYGIRPLVMGSLGEAVIFASETCALDMVGATFIRDIEPGEAVVVSEDGIRTERFAPVHPARICAFEYIYFARPDSVIGGRSVYEARKQMGRQLALETPADVDVVIPVPDSGVPAAIGYSEASGIPFELGIIRSHFVGRTFIQPTPGPARPVRAPQALGQCRRGEGQAGAADRRLHRARHDLAEDRAHDARSRRGRGAFPLRLPANQVSGLLRHRHGRPERTDRGEHGAGRDDRAARGRQPRLPLGRRALPGRRGRAPRQCQSAARGPLFHRRVSHTPRRP